MRALGLTLLLCLLCLPAAGAEVFFSELEDIYVTALADSMPKLKRHAFSVSLVQEDTAGIVHERLPQHLWKMLSARLADQGVDVSGYVSADRIQMRGGSAYATGTQTKLTVWSIAGMQWLGDSRVLVSKRMFRDGLTAQFYTVILERTDGRWVVKARKNPGVA